MFCDLYTPEGEQIAQTPWQRYPRPQLRRDSFLNLNGRWEFAVQADEALPKRYEREILVPFCPESLLSGQKIHPAEGSFLFYRRGFVLPEGFNRGRVLLQIGAADQQLDCYLNGKWIGGHLGGYERMTFELTDALEKQNELVLRVRDDLRDKTQPYGKQTMRRGGMWYTPVSGIWQTVWLESVPREYVHALRIRADDCRAEIDTGDPSLCGELRVTTPQGEICCPLVGGKAVVEPEHPSRWSPEHPYLYHFVLTAGQDRVESYFALRRLEIRRLDGIARLCLNGRPYFFHGVLDQGYYSDGLFTPADPSCYERDILTMKSLGFNTLRKHIKIEPEEFYYQCDRLGMAVVQDMVNNGEYRFLRDTLLPTLGFQRRRDQALHPDPAERQAFFAGMEAAVRQLDNHPCIVGWTIFNEGWGQFDSTAAYRRMKALDDTRFIDAASGWFSGGESDLDSRHIYFGPWRLRAGSRPLVLSEFGGCCLAVEGHRFHPGRAYGYSAARNREALARAVLGLYEKRVLPAVKKGLCAAIYTQLSDVEDEINGLVTYDRKVVKLDAEPMRALAQRLQEAVSGKEKDERTVCADSPSEGRRTGE